MATIIICVITALVSFAAFSNQEIMRKLIYNGYMVHNRKEWWRLITSGFIHADFMHLFVNMFVLFSFGQLVESYYGDIFEGKGIFYYLVLYLGAILVSSAPSYAKYKDAHWYNSLGASGGVAAIMFAAILFQPWSKVYIFGIIPIPGIVMGPLYLFFEYRMGKQGNDNVNHDAHFWGAIFGFAFTILLKPAIFLYFIDELINGFPF